jgi:hypothetical protein
LHVFARGTNNTLYHNRFDGRWSGWGSLGGNLTSAPAVASWSDGRMDVFARGPDLAIYHKWYERGWWSEWSSIGGNFSSGPAITTWGQGRLDVFARGHDNAIYHAWWSPN